MTNNFLLHFVRNTTDCPAIYIVFSIHETNQKHTAKRSDAKMKKTIQKISEIANNKHAAFLSPIEGTGHQFIRLDVTPQKNGDFDAIYATIDSISYKVRFLVNSPEVYLYLCNFDNLSLTKLVGTLELVNTSTGEQTKEWDYSLCVPDIVLLKFVPKKSQSLESKQTIDFLSANANDNPYTLETPPLAG